MPDRLAPPVAVERRRALHVSLWIAQVLLLIGFSTTGGIKVAMPIARMAAAMGWVSAAPVPVVRLLGVLELAGALGVVLPALTRVRPGLTPLAALGLTILMVGAVTVHLARSEAAVMAPAVVLGVLAAFVAWGRFRAVPIESR